MARRQIGNNLGIVIKAGAQVNKQSGGSAAGTVIDTDPTVTDDVDSLRAALQAGNAGRYTNARLANMTVNDMIFALRREGFGTSAVFEAVK